MSGHVYTENSLQQLQESQDELMVFFNAIDEVFFSVDRVNMSVLKISDGCEKLYGYKASDFFTHTMLWVDLIHPDDKYMVGNENNLLAAGEKVNSQYRIVRKDKEIRWVEKKVVPILDERGKLIRADGVVRDITSRKEDEEKHRQSEERFRQIVETAQEGIWTIDENNKTNFVNKKMGEILGYRPDEMIGKDLYAFMHDDDKAETIERINRRKEGSNESLDVRYITKGGEDVWANISGNAIFDATGNYKGSLAMVTDITRRKLYEEALKKSEANLRTIFDNTDSSYILIDAEMKIVSFNALAQRYSEGQNNKSLEINKHISYYFSEARWPFIKETLDKVANGEHISYEINFTDKDGNTRWNEVRWLNIKNNDNKNWGFILANNDITEAKIAELERERITADLIQHNKDLEQFTYIISHNLRAPVANIIGLSDMLGEPDIDDRIRDEVVDRVSLSIRNIDTIIQDLNHILQVRELINQKKETVYFENLVDTVKISIYDTVQKEKVKLSCDFTEVSSAFTIRSYLYSIFYNLISNSIKYRQTGVAPVITIEGHKIGDNIELIFKDNGKGIDLEKNGHLLFGLYKRFDNTMEGKGMGLFMVKSQVETLGGTIKVKSKLGEGTEFIVRLPI